MAGGLTAANVAEAIGAAQPHGVDTAGGVEIQPGQKDPLQVAQFVQAARAALRRLLGLWVVWCWMKREK